MRFANTPILPCFSGRMGFGLATSRALPLDHESAKTDIAASRPNPFVNRFVLCDNKAHSRHRAIMV